MNNTNCIDVLLTLKTTSMSSRLRESQIGLGHTFFSAKKMPIRQFGNPRIFGKSAFFFADFRNAIWRAPKALGKSVSFVLIAGGDLGRRRRPVALFTDRRRRLGRRRCVHKTSASLPESFPHKEIPKTNANIQKLARSAMICYCI